MFAYMTTDVHLLSTSLRLYKGQLVKVELATNIPGGGYFARPVNGEWSDGIDHDPEDSILITGEDFNVEGN